MEFEMRRCCASSKILPRVDLLFVQYAFFFYHSTLTMVAAGPAPGELVPDMVDQ